MKRLLKCIVLINCLLGGIVSASTVVNPASLDDNAFTVKLNEVVSQYSNEKLSVYSGSRITSIKENQGNIIIEGYSFIPGDSTNAYRLNDYWREVVLVNEDKPSTDYAYRINVTDVYNTFLSKNKSLNPNGKYNYDYAFFKAEIKLNHLRKYNTEEFEGMKAGNYRLYLRTSRIYDNKYFDNKMTPLLDVSLSNGKNLSNTNSLPAIVGVSNHRKQFYIKSQNDIPTIKYRGIDITKDASDQITGVSENSDGSIVVNITNCFTVTINRKPSKECDLGRVRKLTYSKELVDKILSAANIQKTEFIELLRKGYDGSVIVYMFNTSYKTTAEIKGFTPPLYDTDVIEAYNQAVEKEKLRPNPRLRDPLASMRRQLEGEFDKCNVYRGSYCD